MMDTSVACEQWLSSYPKFNWRSTFNFLQAPEVIKAVEFCDNGIACFVKGLQHELQDKDYQEAFNCYENGAMQLDSLCLFRLHEIYLGDTNFNVEYNERQAMCHLIYSALVSQFETFDHKVTFWGKLESFWKKDAANKDYILDLLMNPPTDYFQATGPLFAKLFTFYNNKETFIDILPELKSLSIDVTKNKFFSILNAIFDFMAYSYNSSFSKTDLEKYVETILDMLTNDILFDNFFQSYVAHLRIIRAKKKFAFLFQRRLETDCFWIWSFSFLASMKNHYLGVLLSFEETFLEGGLVLKWKNTESWVNNFIAFCYEKGIGTGKNLAKAAELYKKDINQMPRVLYSRYRKVLVVKEKRENGLELSQEEEALNIDEQTEDLKQKIEERLEDSTRMDCYLFYVYGKIYEKIDEDNDRAIEWYQRGVDVDTDSCLKNHLLCNEAWRLKCKKRLLKLQARKGLQVMIINKNRED